MLGISRSHFYKLDSRGEIGPRGVKLGKRLLWNREELEAWASSGCPPRERWLSMEIEQGVRAMRIWRPRYRDKKTGRMKDVNKFWIEVKDHEGHTRRFPGSTNRAITESKGRKIQRLVDRREAGEPLDIELIQWLERIPDKLRDRFVEIGLLDRQRAEGNKPLLSHLEDFRQSLLDKGNTRQQSNQVYARTKAIVTGCKFDRWTEVSASKVQKFLADRRNDGKGISAQTSNGYLQAIKQFGKWLVQDRRVNESPIQHLKGLNVRTDRRHDRRSLEPDELRLLLEVTAQSPKRHGMAGPERALLYRFAAESGLRANEIRNLKVRSFDFENMVVNVTAGYSKRRREDGVPIRQDTAQLLKQHFATKHPGTKAFGGTYKKLTKRTSDMMKADLAEAAIDYVDDAGRYADFHSLRHSTGSLLAAAGVHPKTAQTILRHSKVDLTLSRYTHTFKGQASEAIAKLPDLSLPSRESERALKTGTDNADVTQSDLARFLALEGQNRPNLRTNLDTSGHLRTGEGEELLQEKSALSGSKRAISDENRRGGDSNPRCGCIPTRRFSKPLP